MTDDKPITVDDLYGTSDSPPAPEPAERGMNSATTKQPLEYEETPVIPMEGTGDKAQGTEERPSEPMPAEPLRPQMPSEKPPKKSSFLGFLGNLVLFAVLFGVGVGLSSVARQFLPTGIETPTETQQQEEESGFSPTPLITAPVDPYADWQEFAVERVTIKLPPDVLLPICDSASCPSQGTYLSGGTRLTIATRGAGQALRDFRGAIITDVNGTPFTSRDTTVAGLPAVEFSGTFAGRTAGGYGFSQMRGVMIGVSDTLSIELNHFTPAGITADFAADDRVFDQILETIAPGVSGLEKGATILPTVAPATTSGAN